MNHKNSISVSQQEKNPFQTLADLCIFHDDNKNQEYVFFNKQDKFFYGFQLILINQRRSRMREIYASGILTEISPSHSYRFIMNGIHY